MDIEPCASALKAQKRRDKLERHRQRLQEKSVEEVILEPAVVDYLSCDGSDDSVANMKIHSDTQSLHKVTPPPPEDPLLLRELYLVCIRCASA
jgi:hypothetical protein